MDNKKITITGHTEAENAVLMDWAKKAVTKGAKIGRWDYETRVILVYNVFCSLYRIEKRKIAENKKK